MQDKNAGISYRQEGGAKQHPMRMGSAPSRSSAGKLEYTPPRHLSSLSLSPDHEVAEQQKTVLYFISLGEQGKRVPSRESANRALVIVL